MRPRTWLAAASLVALLAGCASSPTPTTSSAAPSPAADGVASACGGAELIGPDGRRVDLTGTWEGLTSLWFVTQSGNCVTIEGLSRFAGERNGESYRFVFSGDLRADFTLVGRWTWTWACNGPACFSRGETKDVDLGVGFAADGEPTIEVPSTVVNREDRFTVMLERTSPTTEYPP